MARKRFCCGNWGSVPINIPKTWWVFLKILISSRLNSRICGSLQGLMTGSAIFCISFGDGFIPSVTLLVERVSSTMFMVLVSIIRG